MNQFFPHDCSTPNGATWAALLREELTAETVGMYHDWCEERGWTEWAKWLRLHIELENGGNCSGPCHHCETIRARLRELLVGPMVECRVCKGTKYERYNEVENVRWLKCSACQGKGSVPNKVSNAAEWFGVPGLRCVVNDVPGADLIFAQSNHSAERIAFTASFRLGFPVVHISLGDWWADGTKVRMVGAPRYREVPLQSRVEIEPWHGYHRILAKAWPVIGGVRTDREPNNHGIGKKPWCWSFVGSTTLPEPHWLPLEFGKYFSEAHWSERSSLGAVDYPSREAALADLERVLLGMAYEAESLLVS